MKIKTLSFCLVFALLMAANSYAQLTQGMALFGQRCGSCHETPAAGSRAPDRVALSQRTPEAILDAITTGAMKENAAGLTDQQKRIIAEQLTGRPLGAAKGGDAASMSNHCAARPFSIPAGTPAWNGWTSDGTNARFQPAAAAGMTPDRASSLTLKWAFAFPNGASAFGQPSIVGGRVFVGSDNGFVYSLDATSGCVYWSFQALAAVRTAISLGAVGNRYAAYFGDLKGNVFAIDADTGAQIWTRHPESHPLARITGAPTLYNGRLYVPVASLEEGAASSPSYPCCTFRGSVVAYDAATGDQIWKTYTIPDAAAPTKKNSVGTQLYGAAGAAVWSSPTIDPIRNAVYVGTGNAYTQPAAATSDSVMAFDMTTGKLLWAHQVLAEDAYIVGCGPNAPRDNCPEKSGPDYDFGNSPILRTLPNGNRVLVIGQKAGIAWALDPDKQGTVVWQQKIGRGSALGGLEWGSAADDRNAYLPIADAQFGPAAAGGLFALRLDTGETAWESHPPTDNCQNPRGCVASRSAALSVIPGVVFSGTTDGIMRAYSTTDGKVLWEYNTAREYTTVNGVPGRGGSINGPGPVIVGGMLYTNSGYAYLGTGLPGNVLLAFGVQ